METLLDTSTARAATTVTCGCRSRPRDAAVYVDGYYAGIVDDFDGVFQRLTLEVGPHRIELERARAPIRSFSTSTSTRPERSICAATCSGTVTDRSPASSTRSRTRCTAHRVLLFCVRQQRPGYVRPNWLTRADVENRRSQPGMVPPFSPPLRVRSVLANPRRGSH